MRYHILNKKLIKYQQFEGDLNNVILDPIKYTEYDIAVEVSDLFAQNDDNFHAQEIL